MFRPNLERNWLGDISCVRTASAERRTLSHGCCAECNEAMEEAISFVRAWIADLHRIGCPVANWTEKEAERVVHLAEESGLPRDATIALVRDVLRRGLIHEPGARSSVGADLERIRLVHPDRR